MKKGITIILILCLALSAFVLTGCKASDKIPTENNDSKTVIELDDRNYWKYFNVSYGRNGVHQGNYESITYEITGVLDYALYEDIVFSFDVIYYNDGQTEKDYQSYTMRVGCNAAGDASFETMYNGITEVTVGKLLGIDGELVSFENYNRKVVLKSVSGKVIYKQ